MMENANNITFAMTLLKNSNLYTLEKVKIFYDFMSVQLVQRRYPTQQPKHLN